MFRFIKSKKKSFALSLALLLLTLPLATAARSQNPAASPQRYTLLNGLTILHVAQPANGKVHLLLRVQGGAAFDLAGKEGTTRLLVDSLFPDPEIDTVFREEYEGELSTGIDYDAINIRMSGRAGEFEGFLELLRNAVVAPPPLAPEVFKRLQSARIAEAGLPAALSYENRPVYASLAANRALYGNAFPLGRTAYGTPATLARVTPADLLFARERFLNPNNSTLIIVGDIPFSRVRRAALQLLGAWRKSDKVVPATFIQPNPPQSQRLIINLPAATSDVTYADLNVTLKGVPYKGQEVYAAWILAQLMQDRWRMELFNRKEVMTQVPNYLVAHNASGIGGEFTFKAVNLTPQEAVKAETAALKTIRGLAAQITPVDFEYAKNQVMNYYRNRFSSPMSVAERYAVTEAYGAEFADPSRTAAQITLTEVQMLARKVLKDAPAIRVFTGDETTIQAELAKSTDKVPVQTIALSPEIGASSFASPSQAQTTPQTKTNDKPIFAPVPRRP